MEWGSVADWVGVVIAIVGLFGWSLVYKKVKEAGGFIVRFIIAIISGLVLLVAYGFIFGGILSLFGESDLLGNIFAVGAILMVLIWAMVAADLVKRGGQKE